MDDPRKDDPSLSAAIAALNAAADHGWRPGLTRPAFDAWAQTLPEPLRPEVLAVLRPAQSQGFNRIRSTEGYGTEPIRGV